MSRNHHAVVAGAGPSGLVAAGLLARAGFTVEVLERSAARREGTRAPTLWPRAANVLDLLGCGDRFRAAAHRVGELGFVDASGRRAVPLEELACWTLPQYQLEEILEARARELGVRVSREAEVVEVLAAAPGSMAVALSSGRQVTGEVLIGADGAHSAVRSRLDIGFTGHEYDSRFGLVDFVDAAGDHPRDSVETYTGPPGTLVSIPLPDGVIRLVAPLLDRPDRDSYAVIQERLQGYGFATSPGQVRWRSVFTVAVKMAEQFATGGAALIGDSAHIQSPAGGRGMNNAIEDAMALALRLVVAADEANPDWEGALSDYERERRAAVERELGFIRQRTDRWVAETPASEQDSEPVASEDQRTAAMRAAGIPETSDEITGREICWDGVPVELGKHAVLAVGAVEPPSGDDVREVSELRVIGRCDPVPPGVYVIRADGVVVARWSGEVPVDELEAARGCAGSHGAGRAGLISNGRSHERGAAW